MSRRAPTFKEAFLEDIWVSGAFSIPGAFLFVPGWEMKVPTMVMSAVIFASALAAAQAWVLPRMRFPSFILTVLGVAVTYIAILAVAFPLILFTVISFSARFWPWDPRVVRLVSSIFLQRDMPAMIFIAFVMMVGITFFAMVSKKLGPGVLMNWMLGRYYQPRQEERIFMFLDMRDSTTLAEQMGDMKFSALVREFLNDLSFPVLKSKGEVSHYIGDEAVLCWKIERGLKDAHCLQMFFLMQETLESRRAYYEKEFGLVPTFKAGAHVGSVVATQVGEIKSEIVFHGDVLNTSARIQGLCNDLGDDFLISRELRDRLELGEKFAAVSRGEHELKGKALPVEVFAVTRG
jgi:adenylate cyclase